MKSVRTIVPRNLFTWPDLPPHLIWETNGKLLVQAIYCAEKALFPISTTKIVREHFILRIPMCCFLFLKGPLFLISSWKTGTRRATRSSQDWGHEMECVRGFLSVTFYFSVELLSHVPTSQDMGCLLALCNCYSPSYCCHGPMTSLIPLVTVVMHLVLVFLLNFIFLSKASLYNSIQAHTAMNKAPLFHSRLGSLTSFFSLLSLCQLQSPGPGLQRP